MMNIERYNIGTNMRNYDDENLMENTPKADVLMTSMRSMGYSFEAAIADVIDNSISAHATEVQLKFPCNPSKCFVTICDNGEGMNENELFEAMRYGSSASEDRDVDDLGRFGLGLKSASFSQCRELTVASKKDGVISAFKWDLGIVEETHKWSILKITPDLIPEILSIDYLEDKESGTIVLWENFDFIRKSSGNEYAELSRLSAVVTDYIALIYHRYLNRQNNPLVIKVNNYQVKGLDPFLENHPKTNQRRGFSIAITDSRGDEQQIDVKPVILPFQKDLSDDDKKKSGGIENYRTQQGFYIYRNERLIVWGTWFNRRKDELTKHARIRVDIPNSLDDIWGIDIKKQSATIPAIIKDCLKKAVDDAMDVATKVQKYRGRISKVDESIDYIWDRIGGRGNLYDYRINRDSRIFDIVKDSLNDDQWARVDMILTEIENSIPYQQIYIDKSQNIINDSVEEERIGDIEVEARMLIKIATDSGIDREAAVQKLFSSEPFCKYISLKDKLKEEE